MSDKKTTTERYVVTGNSVNYNLHVVRGSGGVNFASMKQVKQTPKAVDVGIIYTWRDPSVTLDQTLAPRGYVNLLGLSVTPPKGGEFFDTTRTTVGLETIVNWADPVYLSAVHDIKGKDYSHLTMMVRDQYEVSHRRLAVTPKGIVLVEGEDDSYHRPFRLTRGRTGQLMLGLSMMEHFVDYSKPLQRRTDLNQQRHDHQSRQQRRHHPRKDPKKNEGDSHKI